MEQSTLLAAGSASAEQSPTGSGINSPDLSPKTGKARRRAISDVNHIFRIVEDLQNARRSQNEKNGRIQGKLNSERPYEESQLKAEGLGYKSNFTTKPLSTTVGKVSARLTKAIQSARYLTSSQLPDSIPDANKKTELFRTEITNCVRRWPGWYNFVNEVASENSTFGWAVVTWLDNTSWRPVFFRQDQAFLPDGTKQTVDSSQFAAFMQYLMPHELADFISDFEGAKAAGWEVMNVVESINNAKPPSIPGAGASPYTDYRRYEDAIRESSVSLSLTSGAKQIMLWHVFATEADGKVSHYIADGNSKKLLFEREDRFDSITECQAFLSYEQAQTLMGSKGIGREIYELSNVLDRARNEVVDRLQLSGKLIVSAPANQINRFKLTVLGNVAIIPDGFALQQNKIESGVEEFMSLNQLLTGLLDQIAGGVTPKDFERERVTKTEVDLYAAREEEKRDDITTRFVIQFGAVISEIQRRIAKADASDEDAKRVRAKLLNFMSAEELTQLSEQPALRTIEDYTMAQEQKVLMFVEGALGDPMYDQRKLRKLKATALVDAEFAEDVLLPENDPTVVAEQARTQQLENILLSGGQPVAVSPRDAHDMHINVLKSAFGTISAEVAKKPDPKGIAVLENFLQHWTAHVEGLLTSGMDKQKTAEFVKELEATAKLVGELKGEAEHRAEQDQLLATDPVQAATNAQAEAQAAAPV